MITVLAILLLKIAATAFFTGFVFGFIDVLNGTAQLPAFLTPWWITIPMVLSVTVFFVAGTAGVLLLLWGI